MSVAPDRLDGRWAVVTGGSKGIGAATAEALAAVGANLALVARGRDDLERCAEQLRGRGHPDQRIVTRTVDVADPDDIGDLFGWLADEIPQLDVFVANAGTGHTRPLLDITLDEWQGMLDLNLTGVMLCCQGAARLMLDNPGGDRAILVVSSIRALQATPGRLAYSTTKAAVNQLVRVAAAELAPHGIRVNGLSPGITDTPLTRQFPDAFDEAVAKVPMGRAAHADDVAAAARFLCTEMSRFTTGTNLIVDGGESLPGR